MTLTELRTHSFIVKIWIEETDAESGRATWRGHVTHVPSGERRYLKELDELAIYIEDHLVRMGVRRNLKWPIRYWLRRWKRESGA